MSHIINTTVAKDIGKNSEEVADGGVAYLRQHRPHEGGVVPTGIVGDPVRPDRKHKSCHAYPSPKQQRHGGVVEVTERKVSNDQKQA